MMKKLLFILFTIVLFGNTAQAQLPHVLTDYEVYIYQGEIVFYESSHTSIIIPEFLQGQTITSISGYAFSNANLTNVTLPSSITSLEENAFRNNRLTSISIPNSVTSIGANAFADNPGLTSITLPIPTEAGSWNTGASGATVSDLGIAYGYSFSNPYTPNDNQFSFEDGKILYYNGNQKNINIPETINGETVTAIGSYAFSHKDLTGITIPNTVTLIESSAFRDNLLTTITIPNSVTFIGGSAFSNNLIETATLGNGLTTIEYNAFNNNLLKSIAFPNSMLNIDGYVFNNNDPSFTSFTLPTPTVQGNWNTGMSGDQVDLNTKFTFIASNYAATANDFAFKNGEITDYYGPGGTIIIPETINNETVTVISDDAFYNKQLTGVTIPNTVTRIEEYAFDNNMLTDVILPSALTHIGEDAFYDNQLSSIIIPNSVTYIGEYAFDGNNLSEFTLPTPAISGSWNMGNNTSGEVVTDLDESYIYSSGSYTPSNKDFEFENGEITDYYGPEGNITIPETINGETVTTIGEDAFSYAGLTNVTIPNTVTIIEDDAFYNNELTSISLPNALTYIGDNAFEGNMLDAIILPNTVTFIGDEAFYDNNISEFTLPTPAISGSWNMGNNTSGEVVTDLEQEYAFSVTNYTPTANEFKFEKGEIIAYFGPGGSIIIPETINGETVTAIGYEAFYDKQLTGITIPDTVTFIRDYAFEDNMLDEVILPTNLTFIGIGAFSYNQLESVNIPNSVKTIGAYAFEDNALTSVTISNAVTSIERGAFSYNQLESVHIPNSVKTIGAYAFIDNILKSIAIPDGVTSIDKGAFQSNELTSVSIPNSVTFIGIYAFAYNDELLTSFTLPTAPVVPSYFVADGWVSGSGSTHVDGAIVSDLNDSYSLNITQNNAVLVSILIENVTGNLDITGGHTNTYNNVTSVNFLVAKGDNLVLTPEADGYTFNPGNLTITNIQNSVSHVFKAEEVLSSDDITEETSINTLKAYPNPSNGMFTLDLGTVEPTSIQVFDMNGRLVKTLPNQSKQTVNLNVDHGVYIINIMSSQGSKQLKVVVTQ
ncbi:leucine-rich repeat protein [Tamlana sp. 2_MG-2023]|uniref:leucine-rich repeat protein n=1 Tax=unclassified Tamlana TaxID=2614803 RepID=UPI0026E2BEF3|nr:MULTISPECIES: leucine-rich repeat protein [unclassified Tamlana]MDO6761814.1 leucine-rich repeat protein [Tamlana sp. 2_MG-2023]MDO6792577.1 leucine-rich repeat protein [Tamlana sp. 1_MG-2023]